MSGETAAGVENLVMELDKAAVAGNLERKMAAVSDCLSRLIKAGAIRLPEDIYRPKRQSRFMSTASGWITATYSNPEAKTDTAASAKNSLTTKTGGDGSMARRIGMNFYPSIHVLIH